MSELRGYDTWKLATPPEYENVRPEDEGYYFCSDCALRRRGQGQTFGWFEEPEPCGCCCDVCGEMECACEWTPERCEAYLNAAEVLEKSGVRIR